MPASRRVRLVVLFGGQSAEHDVSCVSAYHVLRAVDPERFEVDAIGITRDGRWVRAGDAVAALRSGVAELPTGGPVIEQRIEAVGPVTDPLPALAAPDDLPVVVLPLLHGPHGEDGTVQGLLEMAGVPYVGSGVLASALCMDKLAAKEQLRAAGLPQVRWVGVRDRELPGDPTSLLAATGLEYPVFVKPANLGSSVGVSKVGNPEGLRAALELAAAYDEWIVIEEGVIAREVEVGVLGNAEPRASVAGEVVPSHDFYDFDDKYVDDAVKLVIPAPLDEGTADAVRRLAIEAFRALRCDGMARVDFFVEDGGRGPLVNEVNTIPGFTAGSMYPRLWEASGLAYADLIAELVRLALERHDRRRRFSTAR